MRITTHGSPTFRDVRRGLRMPLRAIIRFRRENLARETPNFPLPCQGKSAVIRTGTVCRRWLLTESRAKNGPECLRHPPDVGSRPAEWKQSKVMADFARQSARR